MWAADWAEDSRDHSSVPDTLVAVGRDHSSVPDTSAVAVGRVARDAESDTVSDTVSVWV